jgi:broad specificity phosphatase PhoE
MTELYLVRHGETDWNRQRRIQGLTDIPLNDTGREQARASGRLLARRRLSGTQWDAVITSPLSRAAETGAIIAEELGLPVPETSYAVVERNYGEAEGLDFVELDTRFPAGSDVPGRETREEVAVRVVPALIALAAERPGQRLVIVSHGGAIRAVLSEVDPGVDHGMITNGSIHSFHYEDGALRLVAFNDPIDVESILPDCEDIDAQNAVEARDDAVV